MMIHNILHNLVLEGSVWIIKGSRLQLNGWTLISEKSNYFCYFPCSNWIQIPYLSFCYISIIICMVEENEDKSLKTFLSCFPPRRFRNKAVVKILRGNSRQPQISKVKGETDSFVQFLAWQKCLFHNFVETMWSSKLGSHKQSFYVSIPELWQ